MPHFDGTGPRSRGPMTGWGSGYCAVRIWGPEQEIEYLRRQAMILRAELDCIRTRLEALSTEKEEDNARI